MIRYVLPLLALFLMFENKVNSEEIAGSKNFHLSGGMSKQMYLLMRSEGMGEENLKKFVQMEDRFLQIERNSVCSGTSYTVEAVALSNLIRDIFPKYKFAYHGIHLQQIAEPTKTVNSRVKC